MSDVNTVIFHQGYQEYLEINCEITSKKNQIFLIGDDSLKVRQNTKCKLY